MTDKAPLEAVTAPMDEKAVELAAREIAANDWSVDSNMTKREWQDKRWIYHRDDAEAAIRAYRAASPSPSEMEVVAWQQMPGGERVNLVRQTDAQSALAAMRAERDEARLDRITAERDAQNMANQLVAAEARIKALEEALSHALDHYDRNTCLHESVHRGGSIWTICDDCGRQWADDKGGFQPHVDPTEISAARTTLKGDQP